MAFNWEDIAQSGRTHLFITRKEFAESLIPRLERLGFEDLKIESRASEDVKIKARNPKTGKKKTILRIEW